MKRGLITWDRSELSPSVFERRVETVRRVLADRELSALIVYSELWRSNQGRFFSNYMPYFNRALLIIPRDLPPTLLCGLSPRVYGWIRSVTTIEDVRPAGNFAKPLFEIAAERKWTRIGGLDLDQFPYDIHKALQAGPFLLASVESAAVYSPADDDTERAMRRRAVTLGKDVLKEGSAVTSTSDVTLTPPPARPRRSLRAWGEARARACGNSRARHRRLRPP